jgi:RNA polymerase sigma-70 factor (ECF subfamily)
VDEPPRRKVQPNLSSNSSVYASDSSGLRQGGLVAAQLVGADVAAARAAAADGDGADALYRAHFGPLSGYAQALTGDAGAAVDIAQEAFTRLLSRWWTVRDPRAWLFFVATNLARDYWRGVARDRELADRSSTTAPVTSAHDPWLRDLVERLPARQRQAVLLHYYADITIDEIARLLHVPVGTVKRRLHDGRQRLAAELRESQ